LEVSASVTVQRLNIYGSPYVGIFIFASDVVALVPEDAPEKVDRVLSMVLDVPVIRVSVAQSSLLGVFVAGNSNGLLLPYFATDREVAIVKDKVELRVETLPTKVNALGNLILVNDRAALIHPRLFVDQRAVSLIRDVLGVEVNKGSIAGVPTVGSAAVVTNRGLLVHPMASEDEVKFLREYFKVNGDVGTINCGFPYVKAGVVANSKGAIVGSNTTGPELVKVEQNLFSN